MREILFKAKRKDNGEWVDGALLQSEDASYIATSFLCEGKGLPLTVAAYEIDPETLCQYTGLMEKNGEKIWENDIVSDERTFILAAVKWFDDDYAGWHLYDNLIGEQQVTYGSWGECEVIGNVFDNPELLEVE